MSAIEMCVKLDAVKASMCHGFPLYTGEHTAKLDIISAIIAHDSSFREDVLLSQTAVEAFKR